MRGAEISRPPIYRISLVQLAVLVPLCILLAVFDRTRAWSVACGALVAILPQAWFGHMVFRRRGARAAPAVAGFGLAGEVGKYALSAAGFALVFALLRPLDAPAVFAGYLAMLAVQMTGSWLLLRTGR